MRVSIVGLLTLLLVTAATLPASARSLRHVEFAFSSNAAGRAENGTIALDLTEVRADRTFTFDVREAPMEDEVREFQVTLDPRGMADEFAAGALSSQAETLLYFFTLSHENISGVAPGDHWTRACETSGFTQRTAYSVLGKRGLMVDLGVTRSLVRDDGERVTWKGHVLYDAAGAVPTLIELSSAGRDLKMKLTADSFKHD